MHKPNQRGLTLLEMMVVMAIISILSVVGTPIYLSYAMRAKVGGELLQTSPLKNLVVEHYIVNEVWGTSNQMVGGKTPESYNGKYVESVSVSSTPVAGSLIVKFNTTELPALTGNDTLILSPQATNGGIQWVCAGGSLNERYLPSTCG